MSLSINHEAIQNSILSKLAETEEIAKKSAYFEDGEFVEYGEELDDAINDFYEFLQGILREIITKSKNLSTEYAVMSDFLKAINTYEFGESLENYKSEYPNLYDYVTGGLQWTWAPFAEAVRDFYSPKRIKEITDSSEKEIVVDAFLNPETYFKELSSSVALEYLPKVKILLDKVKLNTEHEDGLKIILKFLFHRVTPQNIINTGGYVYVNSENQEFAGQTLLLEKDMLKWLRQTYLSEFMFDDEDLDLIFEDVSLEIESNLESLKTKWLQIEKIAFPVSDTYAWNVVKCADMVEVEDSRGVHEFPFHVLSQRQVMQIIEPIEYGISDYVPENKFKLTLIRTGLKSEYGDNETNCLLALQAVMAIDNLQLHREDLKCEVAWIREGEVESRFDGMSYEQLDDLAKNAVL